MLKMQIKNINLHFSLRASDFAYLIPEFQISDQGPYAPFVFFSALSFYNPPHLKKDTFFQGLLECGDIKVAHKHSNSMIYWLGQVLVPKLSKCFTQRNWTVNTMKTFFQVI